MLYIKAAPIIVIFLLWCAVCFGQVVSSSDLIANAKEFNGKTVKFAGEVIGDVMRRGDHAWVNVNDGTNAIGIWMPASLAADIHTEGNFKQTGDYVEVTGIFNRACIEHGADMDIHAIELQVIKPGAVRTSSGISKAKNAWCLNY